MWDFLEIPTADLHAFTENVRHDGADHELDELEQDVAARGMLHPPLVQQLECGGYRVICGQRRVMAAARLNLEAVTCRIVPPDVPDDECFLISLAENMHRHQLSRRDQCEAIRRCMDLCDGKVAEVCRRTHLSRQTVRRYADIAKQLDPADIARLDATDETRLTLDQAHRMARGEPDPLSIGPAADCSPADGSPMDGSPMDEAPDGGAAMPAAPAGPDREKKRSVKADPWVFDVDGRPFPIPEELWEKVYRLASRK